jgi:F-type H+-transporting ATPase subunit b
VTTLLAAGGHAWWHATVAQVLAFAILAFIVVKYLFPVIRKMLGDRSKAIADEFARLERELAEAAQSTAGVKAKLSDIHSESKLRIDAALAEAARLRESTMAEAATQAEASLAKSRRDVQIERDKAVLELRAAVSDQTVRVTERIIDGVMNEQVQDRLVEKYVADVGAMADDVARNRVAGRA